MTVFDFVQEFDLVTLELVLSHEPFVNKTLIIQIFIDSLDSKFLNLTECHGTG